MQQQDRQRQEQARKALGARICYLRESKQWPSQQAFADACGMTSDTLSDIERGTSNSRLSTIERIARTLNISISELFQGIV